MLQLLRPWFFWLAAPVVIIVGTLAGIHSANTEQVSIQLTPHPADPVAIVRNLPSVLAGRVIRFDVPAAAIIVQRLDGKTVKVFLKAATVVKFGPVRVRPRDIQVGDSVTVVGRPVPNQGVNAALITIMPRKDKQPSTATPAANSGS
jgi:hypothetical protein